MVDRPRFLIGYGERLTEPITPVSSGAAPIAPYDEMTARARLAPMVMRAASAAWQLPDAACPDGRVVTALTLHPSFVAKSYHPGQLLASVGFEQVGSRPVEIRPDQIAKRVTNEEGERVVEITVGDSLRATTQLFVASTREELNRWAGQLASADVSLAALDDLLRIESFSLPAPSERLRIAQDSRGRIALEVVLHAAGQQENRSILRAFLQYAQSLGAEPQMQRRYDAGSLSFIPVEADLETIEELAEFSFLRVARSVPRLRPLAPDGALFRSTLSEIAELPTEPPLDPELRVAIFDGGLDKGSSLSQWATAHEANGIGAEVQEYVEHGHLVTSALLFGTIDSPPLLKQPFAYVDHYRVLDDNSQSDPFELFDIIDRIETVLTQKNYDFVNLSIGPELCIEDDEVHAWTAFLDNHLGDGRTLLTTAVGNNGELDPISGINRVQVPSDSVNALSVGAVDSQSESWQRATYSAVGPGRSPGLVKPDLVAFGGTISEPFVAVSADNSLCQTAGTSFATPLALRTALGVRAMFGDRLDPLALKALLIHTVNAQTDNPSVEVGWGRVAQHLGIIITCPDGVARVIYQGELNPGKYLRASLPLPLEPMPGIVTIKATLVFATKVDPADPSNYTRSGLDVVFRPHGERYSTSESLSAKTKPFFSRRKYATEAELRQDAGKWETVLNESKRFQGTTLFRPVFDIHHNAREEGHPTRTASNIRYAMVVSVSSGRVPDLYDQVLQTYVTQLEALVPVIEIPVGIPVL